MNEPLTMPRPGITFSGKTHNKHPQWYNQPLRLTKEQKANSILIFDEFFQCYHLNETRQLLWDWLTEIVTRSRSISGDSYERENHMFFYEKMEELIEAAFIIKKRANKQRRKNERRKLKEENKPKVVLANHRATQPFGNPKAL